MYFKGHDSLSVMLAFGPKLRNKEHEDFKGSFIEV